MRTFAHQSVLAMRNARLFTEVDQKGRELASRARHRAQQADKLQEQTEQLKNWNKLAGGAGREAARRDRAHPQARALPRAAGGAADRLLRRPRRAARQPPPRSDRGVLRSARLHGVHGNHRAGRSDERAARISRRARRADLPLRGHARPLCRRRRDDPVQRADPVRGPHPARGEDGGARCATPSAR